MTYDLTCRIKSYIQPFERKLALQELEILAGAPPRPIPTIVDQADRFEVSSQMSAKHLARELAFWEVVCAEKSITTHQSLRESTVSVARNGVRLSEFANLLPF